ncbi:hypothetical protein [Stackebrandtia soli]|uniref:hypothetical protein n=1 Tax=Stackebrandtia soli TaxID=1892856 RepID=UPI0039ED6B94
MAKPHSSELSRRLVHGSTDSSGELRFSWQALSLRRPLGGAPASTIHVRCETCETTVAITVASQGELQGMRRRSRLIGVTLLATLAVGVVSALPWIDDAALNAGWALAVGVVAGTALLLLGLRFALLAPPGMDGIITGDPEHKVVDSGPAARTCGACGYREYLPAHVDDPVKLVASIKEARVRFEAHDCVS